MDDHLEAGLLLFGGRSPDGPPGSAIAEAIELTLAAERAGWSEAWVAEHHFNPQLELSSAMTSAAYLLGATTTMRVGTAASVLTVWHPVALAEQARLLHHASGGRFALGVARGMPTIDFEIIGDGEGRGEPAVFAEALDVLAAALGDDEVRADGPTFEFGPVRVMPGRAAEPVPVFVAANNEPTVRIAAARRLPLLLPPFAPLAAKRSILDTYLDEARHLGIVPTGIEHYDGAIVHVADGRDAAVTALQDTWAPWFARVTQDTPLLRPLPFEIGAAELAAMVEHQVAGTAEQVAEQISERSATLGVRRALLIVDGTGDVDEAHRNVHAVAEALDLAPGAVSRS